MRRNTVVFSWVFILISLFIGRFMEGNAYATEPADEITRYGNYVGSSQLPNGKILPQAVGTHDKGKLLNASLLPPQGEGYVLHKLFENNGSYDDNVLNKMNVWGTNLLVNFIQWFASTLNRYRPNSTPLDIADLSKKAGGPFTDNGHLSHQNGLDVDIGFPTLKSKSGRVFPSFINNGKVNPDMDVERFWLALKILGAQEQVVLIFVDARVKQAMCSYSKKLKDYSDNPQSYAFNALMKLRPWKGHNNHFHLRLQCPDNSPECKKAIPIDPKRGTGCA